MGEKCGGCSKGFVNGDRVYEVRFAQASVGEKSGLLGFYESNRSPDGEFERLHAEHSCVERFFSPEHGYAYDDVIELLRKEFYEDEKDNQEEDTPRPGDDDPPYCLWCKREDTVWLQQQRDLWIFHCVACQKLWDQDEDELVFDPQRGYILAYPA